ncbi:MAG: HTTM domain-containing protein [Candidatus Omnitrophica bacterium]|nr:HTTM domain-containing protein [Candidatus Omnitrophota bacterium]
MERFLDLWYQPIHPGRLRRFEQAFVMSFLFYMTERFRYAAEWLTSEGFHLTAATKSWYQVTPFPLLPAWMVPVFALILFGSGIAVVVGWQRRLFTGVLLVCAVYVQSVDAISAFTLNKFYILVFAVLAAQPRAGMFQTEAGEKVPRHSAWALRTLQATLLIQYFTAGTCKTMFGDWFVHTDVLWSHVQGVYRTEAAAWMLRVLPKWSWAVQMMMAMVFEFVGPFLFLFRRTQMVAIVWGILFHLLIALTMHQLIYFSLQMMTFYILFLPEDKLFLHPRRHELVVA